MRDAELRSASSADVEAIAAFQVACWREAYRGLVPDFFLDTMDLEARTVSWRRRVEQRERDVLVAWQRRDVVGVVSWTPGALDELNTLYVAGSARGTGLATRLLAESIADRAAGLWVFDGNNRARRFYAKHGFLPTGEHQVDTETGIGEHRLLRTVLSDG